MVSPRIWVSCTASENAQQGIPLAQRLISDLRKAGAEVVSESAALPDEQFLSLLQRELASCQWFILVQTPQGMGSRRVQFAIQEARLRLKEGLLRGAYLISASPDNWDEPAPGPEMRSYTYNGDYLRLRDRLLLDLNLLQITGLLEEEMGDTTMGMSPPMQEAPGIQQRTASERIERLAPLQKSAQERGGEMYRSPSSFQLPSPFGSARQAESMTSQHLHKTTSGDRPVPLRFSLPMPSRRFWLYSLLSIFSLVLIVSGAVLAKDIAPVSSPAAQPTPITLTRPSPARAVPTQPALTPSVPTQPTPTPSAPTQSAPPPSVPTRPASTCGSTSVGPFSLAANTVYEWPGGAPWFVTSANCQNISINFSQLTHPVQMQVCFISTGSCNSWQTVSSTGTQYQIATDVLGGTSYRFGIKTGGSATTIAGKVAD